MNYKEIVDYLFHLPRFTKGGHMENVKKLLEALGNPQDSFRYIHVAGTNGKGSVCAYMERCLRLCHKKTGLFTSPHLVRVNERIRINGEEISEADFVRLFHQIHDLAVEGVDKGWDMPTFFEYIYLMAMVYFREQKIDYGIIEAGMGGARDFTNAAARPYLAVITAISLDHVPILGRTVEEIALEKAGIIKPGIPVVTCTQKPSVEKILKDQAESIGAPLRIVSDKNIEILSHNGKTVDFSIESRYHGKCTLTLETTALYQTQNAALAAAALEEIWCRDNGHDFCKILYEGFKQTRWPGRMEEMGPGFFVDGAHNEAGMGAFVQTAARQFKGRPVYVIFAVAQDKDYSSMIRTLTSLPELAGVIVTEIENGRRCSKEEVVKVFQKNWNGMISSTYNIKEAVKIGLDMRGADGILCCVGSLYLAGSIKELAGGNQDDKL
ncbi:MAG TPA: bifunctional folylpolyglutamate synthase/dihydrofolate synthase [Candidatus Scybalocola faecavium]|nr:bifunctional folylpolyglutamate synthase/dihydrofolate synthase [Candidatus Scybalocola faecavium]